MTTTFKNNIFFFLTTSLFMYFSYLCIEYSQSFELSWNEHLEVFQINQNFSEMWIFNKDNLMPPDRGILYPVINRILIIFFDTNIKILRLFSTIFYLISIIIFYKVISKDKLGIYYGLIATVLLATHLDLFKFSILISPYSLSLLSVILLFHSHINFNGTKKFLIYHVFTTLFCILTFYTSAIPVAISCFLLLKKYKIYLSKRIYYYLPLILYSFYKTILIYKYRFILRAGFNNFNNNSFLDNLFIFLNLFNIEQINFHKLYQFEKIPFLLIICLLSIFLITFRLTKVKQHKLINFYLIYLFLTISSYFIMNLMGLHEINTRYYLNLLPLYFVCLISFMKESYLNRSKIFFTILFIGHIGFYGKNLYKHLKYFDNVPLVSITNLIARKISEFDTICFSNDPLYKREILTKTASFIAKKNKLNLTVLNSAIDCTNIKNKKSIFLVSNRKNYDSFSTCTDSNKYYCLPKYLKKELKQRKVRTIKHIKAYARNRNAFITEFVKK